MVVGLAPAAHGANRTGRMFTGDRSGDWLYAALHRAGLRQPADVRRRRDDGLTLRDAYVTAVVRCAPPANKPTTAERDDCLPYLAARAGAARSAAGSIVALGALRLGRRPARARAPSAPSVPAPEAAASATAPKPTLGALTLLGSYHPSQQNTFTGRLTEPMLDAVFARALEIAGS